MNYEMIIELLQNEVTKLQADLQSVNLETNDLAKTVKELRIQNTRLLNCHGELQNVRKIAETAQVLVAELQERVNTLQGEKEAFEQSFKDSQFNLKYWYNECEKLKTDYNQLAGTAGKVTTERDELKREVDHFRDKYDRANAHKTNLQEENNSLILQRDELQSKAEFLQKNYNEAENDNGKLQEKIYNLEADKYELQKAIERLKIELSKYGVLVIDDSVIREAK